MKEAAKGKQRIKDESASPLILVFSPRQTSSEVMWHRYSTPGLTAAQYLSYLLIGASYFLMFGAMARLVGLSFIELGAVFVPLLLGGYASALSFIKPRAAAVLALVCSVPYLLVSILGLFRGTIQANRFIVVTSVVVMGVSFAALLWSEGSVWTRLKTTFGKIAIVILAMLPALFATWWLGSFVRGFLSAYLR